MNNQLVKSTIDHFVSNDIVLKSVTEAGVIHSGENPSNHSPIFVKLQLNGIDPSTEKSKCPKRVNWNKASEQAKINYSESLNQMLANINTPACISCTNVHCTTHTMELEDYTMQVLEAIEAAAKQCLPLTWGGAEKPNITPGWNEYVKPFCEESKFWSSVWQSAGQPIGGSLFEVMKSSKCQYKYAVRRLSRANQKIQNDKFLQGLVNGGSDIFKEIKKFRGSV